MVIALLLFSFVKGGSPGSGDRSVAAKSKKMAGIKRASTFNYPVEPWFKKLMGSKNPFRKEKKTNITIFTEKKTPKEKNEEKNGEFSRHLEPYLEQPDFFLPTQICPHYLNERNYFYRL